eukprot:922133-Prorocentrum_minimum.AAC.3
MPAKPVSINTRSPRTPLMREGFLVPEALRGIMQLALNSQPILGFAEMPPRAPVMYQRERVEKIKGRALVATPFTLVLAPSQRGEKRTILHVQCTHLGDSILPDYRRTDSCTPRRWGRLDDVMEGGSAPQSYLPV